MRFAGLLLSFSPLLHFYQYVGYTSCHIMTIIQVFQYLSLIIVLLSAFVAVIELGFNNHRSHKPITVYIAGTVAAIFLVVWLVLLL